MPWFVFLFKDVWWEGVPPHPFILQNGVPGSLSSDWAIAFNGLYSSFHIIQKKARLSKIAQILSQVPRMKGVRSHHTERASVLDFKDIATPRFGHSDVALDLFIETRYSAVYLTGPKQFDFMSKIPQIHFI